MRYAALLRGIGPTNPNMRNEKLRGVFEKLGFDDVRTVITTGNVLFESPDKDAAGLESAIEEEIEKRLGFFSTTIIRSQQQLKRLVGDDPFGGAEDLPTARLHVTFLKKRQRSDLKVPYRAEGKGWSIVAVRGREICSLIDESGATTPDVMAWMEKRFGKQITTRTWTTVQKILTRLEN